jgi:FHA domain-containing protein
MLKLRIGDTVTTCGEDVLRIGHDPACGLRLAANSGASRVHAAVDNGELIDLGTGQGTYVNGERIDRHTLVPGDKILVGDLTILVETFDPIGDGCPADAGVPCEDCEDQEVCGDDPKPESNRIALKYGDSELVVFELSSEWLKLHANGREQFLTLDGEKLSGLARSLMAAGFALSPAGALLPRSFDDLRATVEEFKMPSTPSGRFARTMFTGIATFAQEQFKAAGIDLSPEPADDAEDEA